MYNIKAKCNKTNIFYVSFNILNKLNFVSHPSLDVTQKKLTFTMDDIFICVNIK